MPTVLTDLYGVLLDQITMEVIVYVIAKKNVYVKWSE